ncbi:hypothetical protein BRN51_17835 [Xanthomonas oryzae pv. oryzae]|uniref:Type I restriction-modification system, S subunit n=3 Tax=Xanthomonas oryzae TaxID=347 RepID=A0A0K0GMQ3_XANOP|nr:type I restriction-modification system, S subunit [Xanthomonas oryzae pv. oryzae PXO99A]AXM40898.1 hypothetical protein BRN51_17835 [Xanthomonas oryzae pv. oryzae]
MVRWMVSELPAGWAETTLGAIGSVQSGMGFPLEMQGQTEGVYPVYKVGDVSRGVLLDRGILRRSTNYVDAEAAAILKGHIFPEGSILFAKIGEALRLNRRAIVFREGLADNNVMGFKADQGIDDGFLYHFLRTQDLASLSRSTTIPSIRKSDVEDITISLPPLAEQKRIVQKLDALLAQVDTLKARIDAMPALLKRFREATLTSAMSGTLTKDWRIESSQSTAPEAPRMCRQLLANERERIWRGRGKYKPAVRSGEVDASEFSNLPEVWHRGTLDEITWSVKDGPHFSPKYATDGVRFISGGNIRPGRIDLSTGKYISQELHEELSARCKPEYLDVLYTKGGTTGFAAVNRTESEFNVWVHVAVLKMLPPSVVDPFFVEFALNSPECYAQSQRYTHGVGNQDLGLRRMIKIVLPVPPIGEQREIVRRVEQLFAYADQLEAKVATAKQRIDALTQSLLAKAFRGELVPQDPAAEPASVLLDRIRAQRAATPKPKRGRKAATS